MPTLPRKEIRNRAHAFVQEWRGETREHAEAKPFWEAFFQVFGVSRRRLASFEQPVKKTGGGQGFIDLLWKGKLLIEHKSAGKDLDKAYTQALGYFPGLKEAELPRYILVSDFAYFSLHDLDNRARSDFSLQQFPDHIHLFDFVAGYEDDDRLQHEELELNLKASEKLGALHDELRRGGYAEHALKIFLTRLLFCLFAEDTGIFARHQFVHYVIRHTAEDGSDTDMHLGKLFQVLDTPEKRRSPHLSEELAAFPYVNGHLFSERIDLPSFSADMRELLIESAWFDWGGISPAIFGSLFQGVMDDKERRAAGAHYTSETNILRLIKPLFLDELYAEFTEIQGRKRGKQPKLIEFQQKLSRLQFLDPACGCGNFLIVTYRELRRLELLVLRGQYGDKPGAHLDLNIEPLISLAHFHGIELDEWPARIAEVAMWLTQHQMNREFARQFGREPDLLPLKTAAPIVNGNALVLDWKETAPKADFILGNPPFVGKKEQSAAQKKDMERIFADVKAAGVLDYVCAWYVKAAQRIQNTSIKAAFVSTNSITQGEQVAPLWGSLLNMGMHIDFAHRTFAWQSEARGKAAVHVVIVGFSARNPHTSRSPRLGAGVLDCRAEARTPKRLFDYPDIKGEPIEIAAQNINPYLADAPDVVVTRRTTPICQNAPAMCYGSMPIDNGWLLFNEEQRKDLLTQSPEAKPYIRQYVGGAEFINQIQRYCLWLLDCPAALLRKMPAVLERVEGNRQYRQSSSRLTTRKLADSPALFGEIRQPNSRYLLLPKVSSENRLYMPIGFCSPEIIASGTTLIVPNADYYSFGLLQSQIHMAWMRAVAGRMKSDYQYSASLVYNNFPWPEAAKKQKAEIEKITQAVLDIRAAYLSKNNTLADLYDPLAMPADLRKAHQKLDAAVDAAYRKEKFQDDGERLAFLFARYSELSGG